MELTTILNRCHRFRGFVYEHARFSIDKKSIEVIVRPRKALQVWLPENTAVSLWRAGALSALASILSVQNRRVEAERSHIDAIAAIQKAVGSEHPSLIPALINFAGHYCDSRRFADAERVGRRAFEVAQKTLGRGHPDWAQAALAVAESLAGQKRLDEAAGYYERAIHAHEDRGSTTAGGGTVSSWPGNGIDYFILDRLERDGLAPSPEASRETLIRRISLDLTGVPATPAEVDSFLKDKSPEAYDASHIPTAPTTNPARHCRVNQNIRPELARAGAV